MGTKSRPRLQRDNKGLRQMTETGRRIQWAPKVRQHTIRRLYENDAQGIVDAELIDEVGYALYARCEAVWVVTERRCPECQEKCHRSEGKDRILTCPNCGWSMSWEAYKRSYKGKRIHGGRAYEFFVSYMEEFRRARGPREKMLAIDSVIHALHESLNQVWTTPASVNLIEGTRDEIIAFLDSLAYGDTADPTTRSRKERWRKRMEEGERATREYYARKGQTLE
jgi:hypothetical protein